MFILDSEQMYKLLKDNIGLFIEYRDKHGNTEELAEIHAIHECLEGLWAQREMEQERAVQELKKELNITE